jgi:hypothetical protein
MMQISAQWRKVTAKEKVDAGKIGTGAKKQSLAAVAERELELELIQTQMAQKQLLRAEVYARALRASQNVKRAEVWACRG